FAAIGAVIRPRFVGLALEGWNLGLLSAAVAVAITIAITPAPAALTPPAIVLLTGGRSTRNSTLPFAECFSRKRLNHGNRRSFRHRFRFSFLFVNACRRGGHRRTRRGNSSGWRNRRRRRSSFPTAALLQLGNLVLYGRNDLVVFFGVFKEIGH